MKIVLVQANGIRFPDGTPLARKQRRYAYAPTTLTSLAALVPPEIEADIEIIDEGVQLLPDNLEADLIGISALTPNATRAYHIADEVRRRGVPVVLGGVHPTLLPQEAQEHADAVVVGFAEEAWPRLLRDFKAGRMRRTYSEPWEPRFQAQLPFARRDLLKKNAYMLSSTLETTRGCPHRCDFCVIPRTCEQRFVHRDTGEVVREIEAMGGRRVVFLDSNPAESMGRARKLFDAMRPLGISWFSCATCRMASNPEWVEAAAKSGCKGVLIGFESLNQASLEQHGKSFNEVQSYKEMIGRLHDHGIAVLGCFIFGMELDDSSVFDRTMEFVNEARIDLVQYSIYTPFPGTPAFARLKAQGRILTEDWSLYDGKNAVFRPMGMTARQLEYGLHRAWRETYGYPSIFRRLTGTPSGRLLMLLSNLGFRNFGKTFVPG